MPWSRPRHDKSEGRLGVGLAQRRKKVATQTTPLPVVRATATVPLAAVLPTTAVPLAAVLPTTTVPLTAVLPGAGSSGSDRAGVGGARNDGRGNKKCRCKD